MTDLIVKSNVKDALKDTQVSGDFYEALDAEVAEVLTEAAQRAQANGRNTVYPRDL